jgi:hypothetical protein
VPGGLPDGSLVSLGGSFAHAVDIKTIRRFADRSKRWLMAYINGLSAEQPTYAEKEYKFHRREYRKVV